MSMESKGPNYFKSPQEAVEVISELLIRKDWEALCSYYYLEDSDVDVKALLSGEFFISGGQPNVGHPGLRGYKHPFDPAFRYNRHREEADGTVFVILSIKIEQGDGMVQKGFDFFKMKKTPEGLQVLPDEVDYDEAFGIPPDVDELIRDVGHIHKLADYEIEVPDNTTSGVSEEL